MRPKAYRTKSVDDGKLKLELFRLMGLFDTCVVCGDPMEGKRGKRWFRRARQRYGEKIVRKAYGKAASRGNRDGLQFGIVSNGEKSVSVPVCSTGCKICLDLINKESIEWLEMMELWIAHTRQQVQRVVRMVEQDVLGQARSRRKEFETDMTLAE